MRFLLFLLLFPAIIKSQEADTLLPEILARGNDTEKVNLLYKAGYGMRNSDPRRAGEYAAICLEMAERTGSPLHIAKSYNLQGVLSYKKGKYREALSFHQRALGPRREAGDQFGVALSNTNLGNIYTDLQDYSSAEACYLDALKSFVTLHDRVRAANCLVNLGAMHQHRGANGPALEYYHSALRTGEELNNYDIRSLCLNNLAIIHAQNGELEKAIAFNEDALKIRLLIENYVEAADSYLNLASVMMRQEKYSDAKDYIDKAYRTAELYDYFEARQEAMLSYSEYYEGIKDYRTSLSFFKRYHFLKDSVMSESSPLPDAQVEAPKARAVPVKNKGLLITLFIFLIFVPVFLLKYKR